MVYNVFDVEKNPADLGFEPMYDVVIACQVLHASSSIQKSLAHVGRLLKPGGKLILEESTSNFTIPPVVVGTFTGFWAGIPDGRTDTPFMTLETWDKNLRAAGFSGTELVLDDYPYPYNTTSTIVSTFLGAPSPALETKIIEDDKSAIHLLYSASETTIPSLLGRLD
jgi:SAM-dependent methyltransferase